MADEMISIVCAHRFVGAVILCWCLLSLVNGEENACKLPPGPKGIISLCIPKDSEQKNIIICNGSRQGVALWSNHTISPENNFKDRLCSDISMEDDGVHVQLEIPAPTGQDKPPSYSCHSGACSDGTPTIDCAATYRNKGAGVYQGLLAHTVKVLAAAVLSWFLSSQG